MPPHMKEVWRWDVRHVKIVVIIVARMVAILLAPVLVRDTVQIIALVAEAVVRGPVGTQVLVTNSFVRRILPLVIWASAAGDALQ